MEEDRAREAAEDAKEGGGKSKKRSIDEVKEEENYGEEVVEED